MSLQLQVLKPTDSAKAERSTSFRVFFFL